MPLLAPVTSATRPVRSPASAALQVSSLVASLPGIRRMPRSCRARRWALDRTTGPDGSGVADVIGGDRDAAPGPEDLEGLDDLVPRVHDEGPVGVDGFADRLSAEDEHVEGGV